MLVSNEEDLYLEQAILSVCSLRMYSPDTYVELVVDKTTDIRLNKEQSLLLNYVSNRIVVDVPADYQGVKASRWLKTNVRSIVKGDYLFIDTDTIIVGSLNEIAEAKGDVNAVLDLHGPYFSAKAKREHLRWALRDEWTCSNDIPYFNSGVMFVKDTPSAHQFYEMWHEKWIEGVKRFDFYFDQSSLAATNEALGMMICELSGIWNCQLLYNGLPFLSRAKIIHHVNLMKIKRNCVWKFYNLDIYEMIKQTHCISTDIDEMLRNAKTQFETPTRVVGQTEIKLLSSFGVRLLQKLRLY